MEPEKHESALIGLLYGIFCCLVLAHIAWDGSFNIPPVSFVTYFRPVLGLSPALGAVVSNVKPDCLSQIIVVSSLNIKIGAQHGFNVLGHNKIR
jgi:hypothetical protein